MNRSTRTAAALSVLLLIAAACGSDDDSSAETTPTPRRDAAAAEPVASRHRPADRPGTRRARRRARPEPAESGAVDTIKVGYSAWPGWFPLAVAEEAGIFEEVGLDVDLRYFADYIARSTRWPPASSTSTPRR